MIVWTGQCEAARDIREGFGPEKAIGYLIGEKFLNFLEAADDDPDFAAEVPRFVEAIKRILEPAEIRAYLEGVRPCPRVPRRGLRGDAGRGRGARGSRQVGGADPPHRAGEGTAPGLIVPVARATQARGPTTSALVRTGGRPCPRLRPAGWRRRRPSCSARS